jgi:hypothetical protein
VPPIALRAIQRSKTFEGVLGEVLELRRSFAPLRQHLCDIEDRMRDGRLSPAEALELESAWRQRWESLAQKLEASSSRMALARTSIPLLKDGIRIVKGGVNQDALDVVAAAVGWIGSGVDALGALQVRPVHRSVSNYLKTTDQDLLRAVAKIFDTDFVRLNADMQSLAHQPGNPWRLALDGASVARPTSSLAAPRLGPKAVISFSTAQENLGPSIPCSGEAGHHFTPLRRGR